MIRVRLSSHWRIRRSEWMLSLCMIALGLAYLEIPNLFTAKYFGTLMAIMPQHAWGAVAAVVGTTRLALLLINGAWRASPHLRAFFAQLSCVLWLALFVSSISAEAYAQSVGFWLLFFIFDAFSAVDAAGDARLSDEKAKSLRTGTDHAPDTR